MGNAGPIQHRHDPFRLHVAIKLAVRIDQAKLGSVSIISRQSGEGDSSQYGNTALKHEYLRKGVVQSYKIKTADPRQNFSYRPIFSGVVLG